MNSWRVWMPVWVLVFLSGGGMVRAAAEFDLAELRLTVDDRGQVIGLLDRTGEVQYAAAGQSSPLLQIRVGGEFLAPQSSEWDAARRRMTLHYPGVTAVIQAEVKSTHVNLELVELSPLEKVDRVQWGPIATGIGQTVGEVIGVVRNDDFAVGLQLLNVKTLGGPADNEEGRDTSRGRTAVPTAWGSTLQAYALDRSRPRTISVWGDNFPHMPVPVIPGETVIGTKIALFGCPASRRLSALGRSRLPKDYPIPSWTANGPAPTATSGGRISSPSSPRTRWTRCSAVRNGAISSRSTMAAPSTAGATMRSAHGSFPTAPRA